MNKVNTPTVGSHFRARQRRWPNPRDSIGDFIRSDGRNSFWKAIGPARQVFIRLKVEILEHLNRRVDPLPGSTIVSWTIYMTGRTQDSAYPVVMFLSQDRGVRENAQKEIKESGILDNYPGVRTGHRPEAVRPLSSGTLSRHQTADSTNSGDSFKIRISGNKIFDRTSGYNGTSAHRATCGGLLRHNGNVYLFTAHHPFSEKAADKPSMERPVVDDEWEIDNDSDLESESYPDSLVEANALDEHSLVNSMDKDTEHHQLAPAALDDDHNGLFQGACHTPEARHGDGIGASKDIDSEMSDCNIQRATGLEFEFELCPETKMLGCSDLDYALLKLENSTFPTTISPYVGEHAEIFQSTYVVTQGPKDTKVTAYTASGGKMVGTLDGTPSYISLPNSTTFQETYTVQFNGPLAPGDCGSWVLDSETGGLYGHIVAGSELQGTAYIMPARDVFEHARARLNRDLQPESDLAMEALILPILPAATAGSEIPLASPLSTSSACQTSLPLILGSDVTTHPQSEDPDTMQLKAVAPVASVLKQARGHPIKATAHAFFEDAPNLTRRRPKGTESQSGDKSTTFESPSIAQTHLLAHSTSQWPASFTSRQELDLALENRPYVESAVSLGQDADIFERFMTDLDDCGSFHRLDRFRNFYTVVNLGNVERDSGRAVAWLDERSLEDGQCRARAYNGPLTATNLLEKLKKPRFKHITTNKTEQCEALPNATVSMNIKVRRVARRAHLNSAKIKGQVDETKATIKPSSVNEEAQHNRPDAERRLIYITDLDALSIYALAATASHAQAPALRDALYKHLLAEAHIGVLVTSRGLGSFRLSFHLPFFACRNILSLDHRELEEGRPLRSSKDISFLDCQRNPTPTFLYEAHVSCVIAGSDDWRWVAYSFLDTYFDDEEERETVTAYHECKEDEDGLNADPLTYGVCDADNPIWDPRQYFLTVVKVRLGAAKREWQQISEKITQAFQDCVTNGYPLLSLSKGPRDSERNELLGRDYNWTVQAISLTTILLKKMTETIDAGEDFFVRSAPFLELTDPSRGTLYLRQIETIFDELKSVKKDLEFARKQARIFQEMLVTQVRMQALHLNNRQNQPARGFLTVMMLWVTPVALSSSIFSMQSTVIPLIRPTFAWFIALTAFFALISMTSYMTFSCRWQAVRNSIWSIFWVMGRAAQPLWGRKKYPNDDLESGLRDAVELATMSQDTDSNDLKDTKARI